MTYRNSAMWTIDSLHVLRKGLETRLTWFHHPETSKKTANFYFFRHFSAIAKNLFEQVANRTQPTRFAKSKTLVDPLILVSWSIGAQFCFVERETMFAMKLCIHIPESVAQPNQIWGGTRTHRIQGIAWKGIRKLEWTDFPWTHALHVSYVQVDIQPSFFRW